MSGNAKLEGTPPKQTRIRRLQTLCDVKQELGRIYRLGHRGQLDPADLSRFANVLNIMAGIIRQSDLEERLDQIEGMLERLES